MPDGNAPIAGGSGPSWNLGYAYHLAGQQPPSPAQLEAEAGAARRRAERRARAGRRTRVLVAGVLLLASVAATVQLAAARDWGAAVVGVVFTGAVAVLGAVSWRARRR